MRPKSPFGLLHHLWAQAAPVEVGRIAETARAVLDVIVDGVITTDAQGTISGINPAAARIFEYSSSQIVGQHLTVLMPPPHVEEDEHDRQRYEQEKTLGNGIRGEVMGRRQNGETFLLELAVGEGRMPDGNVFFASVVQDISERKRSEADLLALAEQLSTANAKIEAARVEAERIAEGARAAATRLAAVLDVTVGGVITANAQGMISDINSAAARMFEYQPSQVIGQKLTVLMPGPYLEELDRDQFRATSEQLVLGTRREVVGRRQSGVTFPLELALGEGRLPDGNLFFAGVFQDISDRKRMETELRDDNTQLIGENTELNAANLREFTARGEADDANRAKSDFLAQMSHELRTPLNAILGFSELLKERAGVRLVPRELQYLDHVTEAGTHLLALINDVLDLSRVDAGRMEFHPETIRLEQLLAPVLASSGLDATAHELDLSVDTAPDAVLWVDARHVRQILQNLLSNAVKFNVPGGRISLSVLPDGYDLVIAVADTGIGIPQDRHDRVFGAFERLNEDRVTVGGSGIGLSLTKRLVELQLGEISFESAECAGSTFRVRLPDAIRGRIAGPRLIVVEDEAASARLIVEYAADAGLECEAVTTVPQALESARNDRPLGVIVDLVLVGERGEDLIEALKANPARADIPVLVISIEDDTGRSRRLGADDHLTKPINRGRFDRWLHQIAAARDTADAHPAG